MYCSFRFYIDISPELINSHRLLNVFELFSNVLGKKYDYISYMLFDPDKNDALIDKKYPYDLSGIDEFLNTTILHEVSGENGCLSAPFVRATCTGSATQIYSQICVEIQFPVYSCPLIIRVDYSSHGAEKVTLKSYNYLIHSLLAMGFCVNNGFYHVYSQKNEAITLDGGQIGVLFSCCGRKNRRNYVKHHKEGFLDRFMGIYCVNSLINHALNEDIIKEIENLVGRCNVIYGNNIVSFSLGNIERITPAYRIQYHYTINKIQKIIDQDGAGDGLREPG